MAKDDFRSPDQNLAVRFSVVEEDNQWLEANEEDRKTQTRQNRASGKHLQYVPRNTFFLRICEAVSKAKF